MEVKMLLWISVLLSFFSLSFVLIKAEKREALLRARLDIVETAIKLQQREISEIKEDVNVLLSTELLTSIVEETIKNLENEVETLHDLIGKPQDLSDTLSDRVDEIESQLDLISSKELVEIDDLAIEVIEIIKGLNFTLGLVRR